MVFSPLLSSLLVSKTEPDYFLGNTGVVSKTSPLDFSIEINKYMILDINNLSFYLYKIHIYLN